MSANVLCWLSLQSAPLPIRGTPQVVQVGALKPTTQPKQLARARARPHSKLKRSPNQSIRDQSKAHANQSIKSARTKNVKSQNISLQIARVQMPNAPAVTKPRGGRMGSLLRRRHPLSLGVTFGSRPGVGGSNPVNTWFFEFCFFTAGGLTAALSMTFQHAPLLDAA